MSDTASGQPYIPTLDGWRAVSIVLVIMHHMQVRCSLPIPGTMLKALSKFGEVGVEVFFGISGLLICSRLLDEELRCGTISVKSFYLRRFFRVVPAASLYLMVIAILAKRNVCPLQPLDWFGSLLFFRNYTIDRLSASESSGVTLVHGTLLVTVNGGAFYLVLPGVLAGFKRCRGRVLGGLAVSVVIWRFVLVHLMHRDYQFTFRTDTHVDALLIPALIALLFYPAAGQPKVEAISPCLVMCDSDHRGNRTARIQASLLPCFSSICDSTANPIDGVAPRHASRQDAPTSIHEVYWRDFLQPVPVAATTFRLKPCRAAPKNWRGCVNHPSAL